MLIYTNYFITICSVICNLLLSGGFNEIFFNKQYFIEKTGYNVRIVKNYKKLWRKNKQPLRKNFRGVRITAPSVATIHRVVYHSGRSGMCFDLYGEKYSVVHVHR